MTAPRRPGLARDRRGNVAVVFALGTGMLMGAGAVGIDLGLVFQARRKAQGAVDIAAMLAAADPGRAEALARRAMADNGYAASVSVTAGSYAGDAGLAPDARFRAGAAPANAVRVGLRTGVPVHFARALGLPATVPIAVQGTAASAQFAAFTIGSGTASLDGGIANAILGAMLGTSLSLSVADYDALLATRVDAFRFLDALAVGLDLKAAGYADVVQARASLGQIVTAMRVAALDAPGGGRAARALTGVLTALPGGPSVPVAALADLGDAGALTPGQGTSGPSLGLLDLLRDGAALANGGNQVSVALGPSVPGLLGTRLTLTVGERRQSSGWVRPSTTGVTVSTAQTRLLIEVSLAAPLGLGTLNLPVYAEVAPARASLRTLTCPWTAAGRRQAVLDVETGLATLAIADVPRSAIRAGGTPPDLTRGAPLLGLPLLTVTGSARANFGDARAQAVTFTEDDIARRAVKRVASTGLGQSLTGGLIGNLDLQINGIGLTPLLRPALVATLSAAAPAVDLVLDATLRTLGLQVGTADVSVDGTLCEQAVLVQ